MPSVQATKMEEIMTFLAEWFTTDEVVILRCVSASLFVVVNEWQYKDILDEIDMLTWEDRQGAPAQPCEGMTLFCESGGCWTAASPTSPTTDRGTMCRHNTRSELDQSSFCANDSLSE